MRIITYSDLHLEFGSGWMLPPDASGDVMILAGDIVTFRDYEPLDQILRKWKKPVLYVTGNHEYYTRRPMNEENSRFKAWLEDRHPHVKLLLEMQQIWEADKKDRQLPYEKINWSVVNKADAARKEATRNLLAEGKLRTGADFERAALIFQHSEAPEDYLLAHTLAVVAVVKGEASATFIAAETLDRYLQSIHQPQIYGTQTDVEHVPVTQEPYNRGLISDVLRRLLNVPPQVAQEELRKRYELERSRQ